MEQNFWNYSTVKINYPDTVVLAMLIISLMLRERTQLIKSELSYKFRGNKREYVHWTNQLNKCNNTIMNTNP